MPATHPVRSYENAVARIESIRASEPPEVRPDCAITLLTHGDKTERVIVLLHGITNCPLQWQDLASRFFDMGYNVLIPRLPHHGYKDRMTKAIKNLTVEELKQAGHDSIDAAAGLGVRITIVGLSLGAIIALWMGQTRADVDTAVGIAPAIALKGMSAGMQQIVTAGMSLAPNIFSWWDPRLGAKLTPDHVYPRFSTHAVAKGYQLGAELLKRSQKEKPAARHLRVIASKGDPSVNNALGKQVIDNWRRRGADAEYHALDWGAIHDIIDAKQAYAMIDQVYPVVIPMILGQQPA